MASGQEHNQAVLVSVGVLGFCFNLVLLAADCGDLDDPENGWVHIAPDTLLGAVALYRCKLGYQLSSDDERNCQANGQWSGTAPTCDRKSE